MLSPVEVASLEAGIASLEERITALEAQVEVDPRFRKNARQPSLEDRTTEGGLCVIKPVIARAPSVSPSPSTPDVVSVLFIVERRNVP